MQISVTEQSELFITILKELLPSLTRSTDQQIMKKLGQEKFIDAREYVFAYLDKSCGKSNSRNEDLALLTHVLNCLCSYITDTGLPVTPNTLFTHIYLLEHAVDIHFPGYAKAGLLRSIICPTKLPQLGPALVA